MNLENCELNLDVQYALQENATTELPSEKQFQTWVTAALKATSSLENSSSENSSLEKPASLTVRVVSSQESQQLNHQFRGKDRPTNVLSFPFEYPAELPSELLSELMSEEQILGDLAICADVVEREAIEQSKKLQEHWAHIVVHGCLHLLGYDHIKDEDAEVMEALEVTILAKLKISDPYHIDH